ncbi:MAG: MATE family efflux transporter [Oscillospiraceae bacterium]|nr:MATE family efflux transporter [Oscillospiraceae bacterium]
MKKLPIKLSDHFTYGKLLRFTVPSMIMMVFTSIYGIVDGFFVSNYAGKTAFAAVNFIIPFLIIISTPGYMFGTGGSALVSKLMGEGKKEEAVRIFSLLVYAALIFGAVISTLSLIFLRSIVTWMGAEGRLLEDCLVYGRILVAATPVYILQVLFQSFFVAAEKPNLGLLTTVIGGVTNMILDYLLVGVLPLGLVGAALASAFSQIIGGVFPLIYFFLPNSSLLRLGKTGYNGRAILQATTNGASELMSNVSMSLVGMLYNVQLLQYAGEDGVAAYGAMMYVSMIFASLFFGFSIGSAPVIGFHFGAADHRELRSLKQKSLGIVSCFAVVMIVSALLLSTPLSRLFVGYDRDLMALTVRGMRIYSFCYPFMGYAICLSGFFTALNDGLTSAAISFLRTVVFQVAAVLLLPMIWGIDGIWSSLLVAESMAATVSFYFLLRKQKIYKY